MFIRHRNRAGLISALAGTLVYAAICTGTAAAQNSDQTKPNDPAQTLKGPDVKDRDVPGSKSSFGDSQMDPAKGRERPVPHMMFMAALRSLTGDDVPKDLHATQDQADTIKSLDQDFRDARRAYMKEHADEIRDLMKQIRPGGADRPQHRRAQRPRSGDSDQPGRQGAPGPRGPRGAPGDGPGPRIDPSTLNDEQRAALDKLKEIRAKGPSIEDCHTKMWAVLTPEQQAYVKGRIAEMQEQAAQRMRDRQRGNRPNDQRTTPPADGQRPPAPRGNQPQPGSDSRRSAGFWHPGPGGPPFAGLGPGPRAGMMPGRAGPPWAHARAPGFAPGFDRAPDAPRMERLAARLEALPPQVRSRVLDRFEMALDHLEMRFQRPAAPPMDDAPIPQ